jgi:hypothetical protein
VCCRIRHRLRARLRLGWERDCEGGPFRFPVLGYSDSQQFVSKFAAGRAVDSRALKNTESIGNNLLVVEVRYPVPVFCHKRYSYSRGQRRDEIKCYKKVQWEDKLKLKGVPLVL